MHQKDQNVFVLDGPRGDILQKHDDKNEHLAQVASSPIGSIISCHQVR